MHGSTTFQSPAITEVCLCLCDKVYHKHEVHEHLLLYMLDVIVTRQYKPNPFIYSIFNQM